MNVARVGVRGTLWATLALLAFALGGCFYMTTPDQEAVPVLSPQMDNAAYLPQTVVEPPATPAPTPEPDAATADDYQNGDFGVVWLRPGDGWTFYDATGVDGFGQLLPMVTLAADDEAAPRFVTLLRADLPPLIVRTFAQMIEHDPDLALQSMAAGMGDLGNGARLSVGDLAGLPAVHVVFESAVSGTNFIWIVGRPQAVFYILAEGFGAVEEVRPILERLRFTGQTSDADVPEGEPSSPLNETRAQLVSTVEELRGLSTLSPVPFQFMPRDDLRALLQERTTADTDLNKTAATEALLKLLGTLPPDADLRAILLDFYGAEIAGYYDQDADTFFLIADAQRDSADGDTPLSLRDQVIFVHEYAHALHDQYFDLARYTGATHANDDAQTASLALIEGDAQMVTSLYVINYVGLERTDELVAEAGSQLDQAVLERTPPFIRDSAILFPYVYGQSFVQSVFLNGGWDAVNTLWDNPPVSTEQILHPERYPADAPVTVTLTALLPDVLGDGWREAFRDTWGEYALRLWLAEALGDEAVAAAAGWDGDQYLYLTDGAQQMFLLQSVWDTAEDAAEAGEALRQWLAFRGLEPVSASRYAGGGYRGYVHVQFGRVFFAFAPDGTPALDTALALLGWR